MQCNIRSSWNWLRDTLGEWTVNLNWNWSVETGRFPFRSIQNHQAEQVEYEFLEGFYYVLQHQIVLKLIEWHPGVVDCHLNWNWSVETGRFLFRAIQITGRTGRIWVFGGLYYVINIRSSWNWLRDTLGQWTVNLNWNWSVETGRFLFRPIQNLRQNR